MVSLDIKATTSSPAVSFEPDKKVLRICGESYPENSFDFYDPVISWIKTTLKDLPQFTLDISITYMNSSSTKCTLDILDMMEEASGRGVKVGVIWRYDRENPRSYEMAEDFREEVSFPFEIEELDA